MAQIVIIGSFTEGTGAVAWDIIAINDIIRANHAENGSFESPLTLPSGLYSLVLNGACAGKFKLDITGDITFSSPPLPDIIEAKGEAFKRLYAINIFKS
ncbi:MAG: hypothetical protein JWN56_1497 [Sphingobacteriales bacterium]|nr:hypothetical protein [Sphingobacteriales bacterium]